MKGKKGLKWKWSSMKKSQKNNISSRDLDHLELEDLTIPDVIKLPNKNNNNSSNNNKDFNNRNINNNNNNNNNANGNGYSNDENTTKSTKGSNIISNVKVDFFSFPKKNTYKF